MALIMTSSLPLPLWRDTYKKVEKLLKGSGIEVRIRNYQ